MEIVPLGMGVFLSGVFLGALKLWTLGTSLLSLPTLKRNVTGSNPRSDTNI